MRKDGYLAVLILLMIAIPDRSVVADSFVRDANSIKVTDGDKDFLESGHVLRYRIVSVDSWSLRTTLFEAAESANANDLEPIELQLFDDVTIVVAVLPIDGYSTYFFVSAIDSICESAVNRERSNGSLEMTMLGHVTGRFWVCDQIYTIGPMSDLQLPYHIIVQLDPKNLPPYD